MFLISGPSLINEIIKHLFRCDYPCPASICFWHIVMKWTKIDWWLVKNILVFFLLINPIYWFQHFYPDTWIFYSFIKTKKIIFYKLALRTTTKSIKKWFYVTQTCLFPDFKKKPIIYVTWYENRIWQSVHKNKGSINIIFSSIVLMWRVNFGIDMIICTTWISNIICIKYALKSVLSVLHTLWHQ